MLTVSVLLPTSESEEETEPYAGQIRNALTLCVSRWIKKLKKQIEEARKDLNELILQGQDRERILQQSRKVDELIALYYEST